jgi:methionine synthase II (cobalamin-independent)
MQFIKMMVCCVHDYRRAYVTRPECHFADEYFEDIGKAYREEIKDLYELGCRAFHLFWRRKEAKQPSLRQVASNWTTQLCVTFVQNP